MHRTLFARRTPNGTRKPPPVSMKRSPVVGVVAAALFTVLLALSSAIPGASSLAQISQKGSSPQPSLPGQPWGGPGGLGHQARWIQPPGDSNPNASSRYPFDPSQPRAQFRPEEGQGQAPLAITTTNWTNLYPALVEVSAVSSSEAWAIGEYGNLSHYTGGAWVAVDPSNMSGTYLDDVKMLSATSGWIAAGSHAFQYDGTSWNEQSNGLGNTLGVYRVAPVSANNVWATGFSCGTSNCSYGLLQWNGTAWSAGGPTLPATTYLNSIAMASGNDGWAAGHDNNNGTSTAVLLHYNGTSWAQVPGPPGSIGAVTLATYAAGDVWMTGQDAYYNSWLYHYSNGAWNAWIAPPYVYDLLMLNGAEGWAVGFDTIAHWDGTSFTTEYTGKRLHGVSGVDGQVWAVGPADTIMSRPGGGPWTMQRGGPTTNALYSVSALSTSDAWAVGQDSGDGSTILHYTGGAWNQVPTDLGGSLDSVQMLSSTEGYAVGDPGIVSWDGTSWTQVATPTGVLYGLFMQGSGEGWAVGSSQSNVLIWHDSGGIWSQVATPVLPGNLHSVAMDSPSHGWAVGYSYANQSETPILLEYTGGTWVDRTATLPAGHPNSLNSILLEPGGSEGWAVGSPDYNNPNSTAILHLVNGNWSLDTTSNAHSLYSLAPEALGETWAVGCDTYHRVDGIWQGQSLPTNYCQPSISLVPGRGGWTVSGYYGEILQYDPLADGRWFYDVPVGSTFYSYIECMASNGIISGYQADNTFRPSNNVTRGQISKIIALSANYQDPPGSQLFEDVLPGSTFYTYVQQLAIHGILSGYACGGPSEPCGPSNLPYFRPNNNASRGQITKIVSNAAGYNDPPGSQLFEDVVPGSTFYDFVQRLASRSIMGGYACGGMGEPCGPGNLPYFRPSANATRGQTSKIVTNTFFPSCSPVSRK